MRRTNSAASYFKAVLLGRGQVTVPTLLTSLLLLPLSVTAAPPYGGTAFVDPDIIIASDASVYGSVVDRGRGTRTVFDRRTNVFGPIDAYLFEATGTDGSILQAQINPEFGSVDAARLQAQRYVALIGQLPKPARTNVKSFVVHQGDLDFGGDRNGSLLIHAGRSDQYDKSGYLEEILLHEACHASLDASHENSPGWRAAQAADGEFVSTYARDNPNREDVAESFLMYLAVRNPHQRVSATVQQTVRHTIPNRIAYFDIEVTLDWAERTYPTIFASQGESTQSLTGYRFRAYKGGHYLAVATSATPQLLYLGPLSNGTLLPLGPLATWVAQALR